MELEAEMYHQCHKKPITSCVTDLICVYMASLALSAYALNGYIVLCVGLGTLFSVLALCAKESQQTNAQLFSVTGVSQ